MPLFMRVDEGVLVNPGSLYTFQSSRQSSKTYGVLDLEAMSLSLYEAGSKEIVAAEVEYEY
jgi:predicted phosphodiesterase